ncbi:hypothetical protein [Novosphingobium sp. FKTRR1]|uniref:hypothetical protein n=1 Tax=Novosphingobium sp. FKTRR1 TaxID=2879118 RepID=UPI001CEFE25B|nr:hypothetical protein [Novosphingobium sp. FKTRR1]
MPRMKPTDKIEALRQKQAQIAAQLKAAEAREKETVRKSDTRRKVIAGALAVEHMDKNPKSEFAKVLGNLLNEYVTRPGDRALFPSLPELGEDGKPKLGQPPKLQVVETAAE